MTKSHWTRPHGTQPHQTSRWSRIALAAALAFGMALSAAPLATAAEDDDKDEAFDTKFFRNILSGLGLRRDGSGIDYRERSPLVVPPQRNLPPPETASVAERAAAWPNDPDVKRAKDLKAARKQRAKTVDDEKNPELPDQLGPRHRTTPSHQVPKPGESSKDPTAPSAWSELNPTAKNILSLGGLVGTREEYGTFTGEPPRTSLTEPPPGYRTPSAAYRYGVGKDAYYDKPVAANPLDHGGSNTGVPGQR